MLVMDQKYYYLDFSLFPGIGVKKMKQLLDTFGAVHNAWEAEPKDLKNILGEKLSERFVTFRKTFSFEKELKKITKKKKRRMRGNLYLMKNRKFLICYN